jgi:hypothetical protein
MSEHTTGNGPVEKTACHRYVVVGMATTEYSGKVAAESIGGQGQGDPGKNGMFDPGKGGQGGHGVGGPFVKGVFVWKGIAPTADMGAIEFPNFVSAVAWLGSPEGAHFSARYEDVFVLATHACPR